MVTRFSFLWVTLFAFFISLSTANADNGDIVLSLEAVGDLSPAAGLTGLVRYGLSDELSVESGLGTTFLGGEESLRLGAIGSLGIVLALDVFTWVPELTAGLGTALVDGDLGAFAYGGLTFRWVLDFNWSLFTSGEAGISLNDSVFSVRASIGASYQLD